MAKDLSVSVLLDFYGELLTPRQAEALDCYYNQDLSLAEIAADMGVSRQGARAFIKQGEGHLTEFEAKLGLVRRFSEISGIVREIQGIVSEIPENDAAARLNEKIEEMKSRL